MDRALSLELLASAVGEHELLPDPVALRRLLADTEVSLFVQRGEIDEALLDTGWYLQAVASARAELGNLRSASAAAGPSSVWPYLRPRAAID